MKIAGAHFLITGGNRGIGLAVAEMAATSGAHIYIAARSWDDQLSYKLKEKGALSVQFLAADLSSREGVEKLLQGLENIPLDILFNNAGALTGGLLEEQPLDEIYNMLQINLNALITLTRGVLPGMIRRRRGKIINNASVSAFMHFPCASTYAAAKAGVVAFTNCIEGELAGTGVSTLCLITPGIKTRMFDQIEEKYAKNLEIPQGSISPEMYADEIRKAIQSDQRYYLPRGATGFALWIARFCPPLFRYSIKNKFKR